MTNFPLLSDLPQIPRHLLTAAAIAAALVAGSAGCSKGDEQKAKDAPPGATSAPAPAAPASTVELSVTGVDSNGTTAPDDTTLAAVKKALDGWVAAAVVTPLRSGQPAGDLSPLFTGPALERLADPGVRAALVDEGLPAASKSITPEVANVALSSVSGPEGPTAIFAARVDLKLRAIGADSDVDIVHQGDLVLVAEADIWKIDSFAMHTTRDSRP